jgi:hypothetical protein
MAAGEWIAICGLSLSIVTGLIHTVWLLSSIKTTVDRIDAALSDATEAVEQHAADCNPDRSRLNWRIDAIDQKLAELLR